MEKVFKIKLEPKVKKPNVIQMLQFENGHMQDMANEAIVGLLYNNIREKIKEIYDYIQLPIFQNWLAEQPHNAVLSEAINNIRMWGWANGYK